MDDEERISFIKLNLTKLTKNTVLSCEFVVGLLESGLIEDSESHILLDTRTPSSVRNFTLYIEYSKKWTSTKFEDFKRILKETNNLNALQVLSNYRINPAPSLVTATELVPKNSAVPNNQKQDLETFEQPNFKQPSKTNETDKLNLKTESCAAKDEDQILTKGNSVRELVRKLNLSRMNGESDNNEKNGIRRTTRTNLHGNNSGQNSESAASSEVVKSGRQLGGLNMTGLPKKKGNEDFYLFTKDKDIAWKLLRTFSEDKLYSHITNEETRVCDTLGWTIEVSVALGEQFVPRGAHLAKFRGKYSGNKGKTIFEMNTIGRGFAMKLLWFDLEREFERGDSTGPVTVALMEAVGRSGGGLLSGWHLIQELEDQTRRRSRKCSKQLHIFHQSSNNNGKGSKGAISGLLLDWVTKGVQMWNMDLASAPLEALPFYIRYSQNVTPTQLRKILQENKNKMKDEANTMAVLRSLIMLSSEMYQSDEQSSSLFSQVAAFLEENIKSIPHQLTPLTRILLLFVEKNEKFNCIARETGGVFMGLIQNLYSANVDLKTWEVVLCDVIKCTPCCDLPATLQELRKTTSSQVEMLEDVLTSFGVFEQWKVRFWSWKRKPGENCDWCGLRHLLSFYFSVFGFDNLEWMKKHNCILVKCLPVEISTVLSRGDEPNQNNTDKLLQMFRLLVGQFLGYDIISFVNQSGKYFGYRTEEEWEGVLNLIGGNDTQCGNFATGRPLKAFVAAPLIQVLIRKFGVEWTGNWLRRHRLWQVIPSTVKYRGDSVESFGSLLHSAIELGELEEVKRRAGWPGLVLYWRNSEGKTALDVANKMNDLSDRRRIIVHLEELYSSVLRT